MNKKVENKFVEVFKYNENLQTIKDVFPFANVETKLLTSLSLMEVGYKAMICVFAYNEKGEKVELTRNSFMYDKKTEGFISNSLTFAIIDRLKELME